MRQEHAAILAIRLKWPRNASSGSETVSACSKTIGSLSACCSVIRLYIKNGKILPCQTGNIFANLSIATEFNSNMILRLGLRSLSSSNFIIL